MKQNRQVDETKVPKYQLIRRSKTENNHCSCGGKIHRLEEEDGTPFEICGDCNYMWSSDYEGYRYLLKKESPLER